MKLFRHPDLTPLEIWHGRTTVGPLFELSGDALSVALSEFLTSLHVGQAKTLDELDTLDLNESRAFQKVYLTGGAAPAVFQSLKSEKFPFSLELVEKLPGLSGYDMTVDWGQTAIKIYRSSGQESIARDLSLFPILCAVQNPERPHGAGQLKIRSFLAGLLSDLAPGAKLALGLPVKISSELFAQPSTYEGLHGDLRELFQEFEQYQIEVMNDAVLAARQVQQLKSPLPEQSLVLTLGYGVGAALWKK